MNVNLAVNKYHFQKRHPHTNCMQNQKDQSSKDSTLVVGVNIGSITQYAESLGHRGVKLGNNGLDATVNMPKHQNIIFPRLYYSMLNKQKIIIMSD